MTWRPFLVVLALVLALLGDALLVSQEEIPQTLKAETIELKDEPLRHMSYRVGTRRQNFSEMGVPDDVAEMAAKEAEALEPFRKRFMDVLEEQALEVGGIFCPKPSDLPQPYAATELLVIQNNESRDVIDAKGGELFQFEKQPWYSDLNTVLPVYNTYERTITRRTDATIMGVASILMGEEEKAIKKQGAWSEGLFAGGFEGIRSERPGFPALAARYFGLMHFLTELANGPEGICRG